MKLKYIFMLMLSCALMATVLAGPSKFDDDDEKKVFPNGCYNEGYSFKYAALLLQPHSKGRKTSIYFMHNTANSKIKIYQMRSDEDPYVVNLNNEINANQWGAYASDEKIVKFICVKPEKNSMFGEIVDCEKVLELCEYTNSLLGANQKGNYWMVSSASRGDAKHRVKRQGALLQY